MSKGQLGRPAQGDPRVAMWPGQAKWRYHQRASVTEVGAQYFPKQYSCIWSATAHLLLLIAFRNCGIPGAIVY